MNWSKRKNGYFQDAMQINFSKKCDWKAQHILQLPCLSIHHTHVKKDYTIL